MSWSFLKLTYVTTNGDGAKETKLALSLFMKNEGFQQ